MTRLLYKANSVTMQETSQALSSNRAKLYQAMHVQTWVGFIS